MNAKDGSGGVRPCMPPLYGRCNSRITKPQHVQLTVAMAKITSLITSAATVLLPKSDNKKKDQKQSWSFATSRGETF